MIDHIYKENSYRQFIFNKLALQAILHRKIVHIIFKKYAKPKIYLNFGQNSLPYLKKIDTYKYAVRLILQWSQENLYQIPFSDFVPITTLQMKLTPENNAGEEIVKKNVDFLKYSFVYLK